MMRAQNITSPRDHISPIQDAWLRLNEYRRSYASLIMECVAKFDPSLRKALVTHEVKVTCITS
jgi:hypothetical protein